MTFKRMSNVAVNVEFLNPRCSMAMRDEHMSKFEACEFQNLCVMDPKNEIR